MTFSKGCKRLTILLTTRFDRDIQTESPRAPMERE